MFLVAFLIAHHDIAQGPLANPAGSDLCNKLFEGLVGKAANQAGVAVAFASDVQHNWKVIFLDIQRR
jgi:hypothetical protein